MRAWTASRPLFRKGDDLSTGSPAPKGDSPGPYGPDASGSPTRTAADSPGSTRTPQETRACGDPVDVATGRVFPAQTDLRLPGGLPLELSRTFNSGFRSGGWFGRSWASSFDERLVIDERGLILVRADGDLLSYPTPELGGEAVLPVTGTSRWPLTLDAEGYRVTDPVAGLVRSFTESAEDGSVAHLAEIRDRAERWVRFTRDAAGAPTRVHTSGGYALTVQTQVGRVSALSVQDGDRLAEVARFGYLDGLLAEVWSPDHELPGRFEYDTSARMTGWVDRNAVRYEYVYDDQDRCESHGSTNGDLARR